jgi:hypothetical protein
VSRLPFPLPPEGDEWWMTAPIADILDARIQLWKYENQLRRALEESRISGDLTATEIVWRMDAEKALI